MRLFLAIEVPDAVRQHLADFTQRTNLSDLVVVSYGFDANVTVTRPENLHVTLKFLGEVDEPAAPALTDALRSVRVEAPIKVWAGHPELLPPRGPIGVVSVGLDGDVGRVALLHRAIEGACEEQGFPPDPRPYLPHITLGRARKPLPGGIRATLAEKLASHLPGPQFEVDRFALFESQLGSGPPRYVRLAEFGG